MKSRTLLSLGLVLLSPGLAWNQEFPNKPIRIVTTGAGTSSDFSARLIAQGISGNLGQPIIVDNRGSGFQAVEIVSKSSPDGHTLLEGGVRIWLAPFLQDNVPWDPIRDFAPITQVERSPTVLVVHPTVEVTSVKQLIALAKAKPGALNYSSAGAGGTPHLASELFKSMAGVNIVWVPYKSGGQAMAALIGGEVQMTFASAASVAPHMKSGKLRALAASGTKPSALAPGLPTIAESGLPGYSAESLDVILARSNTPAPIVKRLNTEIVQLLNKPDVKARMLSIGVEVVTSSPEELATTIKSEMARWGKLIKDAGIRAD